VKMTTEGLRRRSQPLSWRTMSGHADVKMKVYLFHDFLVDRRLRIFAEEIEGWIFMLTVVLFAFEERWD